MSASSQKFTLRLPQSDLHTSATSAGGKVRHHSKLCDLSDWSEPAFADLAERIMGDPSCKQPFLHRKIWEFAKAVEALQHHGVWHENSMGLSVAGGKERFLYFAANEVKRIVSADIYGCGDFRFDEADESFLQDPSSYAPFPYREDALDIARMNALSLGFPEDMFDFVVCFSSVEHFGGIGAVRRSIGEMTRVLRPGGVLVITTDCSLNGNTTNEVFTPRQLESFFQTKELEIPEAVNYELSEATREHVLDMHVDDLAQTPHLNLKVHGSVFTSVVLVAIKKTTKPIESLDQRSASLDSFLEEHWASPPDPNQLYPKPNWKKSVWFRKIMNLKYRADKLRL
jgi:SAM-dependent methyltransferase